MKLLSVVEIRPIEERDFSNSMEILDKELKGERVRNRDFLYQKFKEYPKFFIGAFLDNEIVGVICGFPRKNYLLVSELAILLRFQKKGFGRMLMERFEEHAKAKYNQINVGAEDNVIGFYSSLGYKPFLLVQFKKEDYSIKDFCELDIKKDYKLDKENMAIEINVKEASLKFLNDLRKRYPNAWFQYIFTKKIR